MMKVNNTQICVIKRGALSPISVSLLTVKWHKVGSMPIKCLSLFYLLSVSSWKNEKLKVQSKQ